MSVFSRSSLPPMLPPLPRARPMASISSMKTMHGAIVFAWVELGSGVGVGVAAGVGVGVGVVGFG